MVYNIVHLPQFISNSCRVWPFSVLTCPTLMPSIFCFNCLAVSARPDRFADLSLSLSFSLRYRSSECKSPASSDNFQVISIWLPGKWQHFALSDHSLYNSKLPTAFSCSHACEVNLAAAAAAAAGTAATSLTYIADVRLLPVADGSIRMAFAWLLWSSDYSSSSSFSLDQRWITRTIVARAPIACMRATFLP